MSLAPLRDFARAFASKWSKDEVATHGAALAYYALFSIAPLLVVTIAVAGLVLGDRAATSEVLARLEGAVGPEPARVLRGMVAQLSSERSGMIATALGLVTMLAGATGVLVRLQSTLHRLWGAPAAGGILASLRQRAVGLALIIALGLLVLASMATATALHALAARLRAALPVAAALAGPTTFVVTLGIHTIAFTLLFRVLPGARTAWRDLWVGGLFTAVLFALGTEGIAWYLGRASTSVYGAAGSLVLLLLWIYYSAEILLAGAVFTVVWSRRRAPTLQNGAMSA